MRPVFAALGCRGDGCTAASDGRRRRRDRRPRRRLGASRARAVPARSGGSSAPSSSWARTRARTSPTYDERMRQLVARAVRPVCRRRGERRRRALHGHRRVIGRRRAGRADLHGLRDRRGGVPSARALRRARAPPPHPADRRRRTDLVLGLAGAGRLRRAWTTRATCCSSTRRPARRPRSCGRSRSRAAVACARCGARSISCAARAADAGDDVPPGDRRGAGASRPRRRRARAAWAKASSRCGWRRPTPTA